MPNAAEVPVATVSGDDVAQKLDLMQRIATHPAFPAVLAAFIGHGVIDLLKEWRDARGKSAWRPGQVRALSFLITQAAFVVMWAATLWFSGATWGPTDFAYGLLGSGGAIAWHHWSPWREREAPAAPSAPPSEPPAS